MPELFSPPILSEKQLLVLAIEDQEEICLLMLLLHEMFCKLGHICVLTSDYLDALSKLSQREFDMVITDISVAGEDGIGLIKRIKADFPQLDVIGITANQTQYHYTDIIKAGASDFIMKPFSLDELETKIERIVRDRCLTAELIELSRRDDGLTGLYNFGTSSNYCEWKTDRSPQAVL